MTAPSHVAVANLLYRYAELMDLGQFEGAAELFADARILLDSRHDVSTDAAGVLAIWIRDVIRYPDGTPRTKHVTTNAIIDVDEATGTATSRSYYTVFQQTDDLPLQPIVAGRYHDRFARRDDRWYFTERDYSLVDLIGDLSHHLRRPIERRG